MKRLLRSMSFDEYVLAFGDICDIDGECVLSDGDGEVFMS